MHSFPFTPPRSHTDQTLVLLDVLCDGSMEVPPAQDIPSIISIVIDIASPVGSTILLSDGEKTFTNCGEELHLQLCIGHWLVAIYSIIYRVKII